MGQVHYHHYTLHELLASGYGLATAWYILDIRVLVNYTIVPRFSGPPGKGN